MDMSTVRRCIGPKTCRKSCSSRRHLGVNHDILIAAFNNGDAATAAAQYTHNAVMVVEPFGTYTGRSEIQEFWENIIGSGFDNVEYMLPEIEVIIEVRSRVIATMFD